jgi:hypothetical protein
MELEVLRSIANTAQFAGLAERVGKRRKERATDPRAKMSDVAVRVLARDEAVLAELREVLRSDDANSEVLSDQFASAITPDLVAWPRGGELALDLAIRRRELQKRNAGQFNLDALAPLSVSIIQLAEAARRTDLVRREVEEGIKEMAANAAAVLNRGSLDQWMPFVERAVELGMADQVLKMIQAIRTAATDEGHSVIRQLNEVEPEVRMAAGAIATPQAFVWQSDTAPDSKAEEVSLRWRIGVAQPASRAQVTGLPSMMTISTQTPATVDGRYDLEIVALIPPNIQKRVALIRGAKASGVWRGRLPAYAHSVQGILIGRKDPAEVLTGVVVRAAHTPNLIVNPAFKRSGEGGTIEGWSIPGEVRDAPAGAPDNASLTCELVAAKSGENLIKGESIPLEPDKDYMMSGWLRLLNQSMISVNLGVAFLDESGKELSKRTSPSVSVRWGWRFACVGFTTHKSSEGGFSRVPERAKFAQPFIRIQSDVLVSELRLVEMPRRVAARPGD